MKVTSKIDFEETTPTTLFPPKDGTLWIAKDEDGNIFMGSWRVAYFYYCIAGPNIGDVFTARATVPKDFKKFVGSVVVKGK